MTMRYETQEDRDREIKAIKKFVNLFKGSYKKLGHSDIDFRVFDKDKKIIAYVEVKGKSSNLKNAFPVYVAARKLVKLCDKRLNPVIIWACDDGIVYGQPSQIEGSIRWGGRKPREGAVNDQELMIYYPKQKTLRYHTYH